MGEYSPAKTGEYPRIFPNFKNRWIINTIASIWLRKYARIFVLGHYLFLEAHSFPRASLSKNCSLLGTDNVRGQISEHIFAPNEGYCLFIIWQAPREGSIRRILCYDWLPQRARCSNTALPGLPVSFPQVKFRQSSSRCANVFFRRNYFLLR